MLNFAANDAKATVPFMEECKPFSLSLPPIRRVVDSTKFIDSISQSECLPSSVEYLSFTSSSEYVKVEPVIDSTDYTGVEPKARLNRSDDTEERTECKTVYRMIKEEKDRLSNLKEEEEGGERQSVKMERDDGVKYSEGLGREQQKAREEQQRNGVSDQIFKTHRCQWNGGKSEYGQQEGAGLSTLSPACLLKQPRVLICRLKITDISVSVSSPPPHPMANKEDWGVKVPHAQHELSTLKGSCSLRQKDQVITWKRKMIGQLVRPQKQLPASSKNGICVEASHNPIVISPRNQNTATVPFMEECKPFSLSLSPIRRVVDSTKLTDSISQAVSLHGSVECLSSTSSSEYVKVEPVFDSTYYPAVEPKARLNRSDDTDERTEWKTAYGMTKEEKDRLSNIKEEEEGVERQSVKMERDDGVKYGEGLGREQEKVREEQQRNGVTDQTFQTNRCLRNGGKSEYGQQEGAGLSNLAPACLLKQPRVLICRLKITDISVSVSSPPPHPMASKEDWGVKVPHTQHELSTLKGSCSLRQKDQVITWKRKMIGQLVRPQKQLPASSENGICVEASHNPIVISPRNQNTGTSGAAAAIGREGPLCEEEEELYMQPCPAGDTEKGLLAELKQEPDGEPLTPGHPLPGSAEGLEIQCVWSKATRSGKVREMLRHQGGGSEHGGAWSKDRFSPCHFRASWRLCSEKDEGPTSQLGLQQNDRRRGPPDGISREMAFPLGSRGECAGSDPCGESSDASVEAESHRRIVLKHHQRVHPGEKPHLCEKCGKSFTHLHHLKTHQRVHTLEKPHRCDKFGKSSSLQYQLNHHQRVHTGKKPHCSEDCGKSIAYLRVFKDHQRLYTGEKLHSCDKCGKSFVQLSNLKRHQRLHTGEKPHSCDKCRKNFAELRDLKTHQSVHTGEKPHSCDKCGKSFVQLSHLKRHQRVHTGEKLHHCDKCGKNFADLRDLKTHQSVHTGEKQRSCDECGKSFAHLSNLKCHQRVHTGEKPHSCDKCDKSFAHLSNLKTHQIVHTGVKLHSCVECGKSFARLPDLKTHQWVHTGVKLHSCVECGNSFSHLSSLKYHQWVHTGVKLHSCEECGKSFAYLSNLKDHQWVHTGVKLHSCVECGKSFARLRELKTHQRVHTGEKPHSCEECGKSFAHLSNLKTHRSVHTGVRPHSCEECGKSFAYLSNLKDHQWVHTGEKRHSCDECGKSFARLPELKTHQRVHTGEKPHSCDECGKSFSQLSNLKTHKRVHTGEKPHSCDECGKSFSQLSNLKTHKRVHTGAKQHSCDKCGKSFADLQVLKHHQRVHIGEKQRSCDECGKSFARLSNLKCHQRVHTGEKPHSCDKCDKSFAHLSNLKTHQMVHRGEKPHSCDECGKSFAHLSNLKAHQWVHTGVKLHSCDKCGKSFARPQDSPECPHKCETAQL